jgi:hypothetical protein
MFVELKVFVDPFAGRRYVLAPGQSATVGRLVTDNHFAVPDRHLAPRHFSIASSAEGCTVTDLSHNTQKHRACEAACFLGTLRNAQCPGALCRVHDMSGENGLYHNGKKVQSARLADGDVIIAGTTYFTVTLSPSPPEAGDGVPPAPASELSLSLPQQERALAFFTQQKLPLFALLDAARDPSVLELLRSHSELHYSLYDGPEAEKLSEVAPYLVQLSARSPLTEALIRKHWGQSFGTFVYALTDFTALRRHLRRFLMVEDERKKRMYFRFYDPRVLRAFLPTCTTEEATQFFGPIAYFLIESDQAGTASVGSLREGALRIEELRF